MARLQIVELIDDIDGKPADENITFSLDGVGYEIDLSKVNAEKLRKLLTPYVEHGRKVRSNVVRMAGYQRKTQPVNQGGAKRDPELNKLIRDFARKHGVTVGDKGRIPGDVVAAYEANDPKLMDDYKAPPEVTGVSLNFSEGGTLVKKTTPKAATPKAPARKAAAKKAAPATATG